MNIDLNLLRLFSVIYRTRSVSQTAEQLNLSQSACSHALTRLRDRLKDELFIRAGNKMLPTEYAHHLAEQILPALTMLEDGLKASHGFSPYEPHTFTIAVTDYTSWCLSPFTAHLSQHFPDIHFEFVQLEERIPGDALMNGKLDFVCGFEHQQKKSTESICRLCWFEDHYVNIRCRQTWSGDKNTPLTSEAFLAGQHILITPWNEPRGIVDIALAGKKKKRRVALKAASVLAAPYFVPNTPYLLTLPNRYAQEIHQRLDIEMNQLPFELPTYKLMLYWHKTRDSSDKIQWFLQQFQDFHQREQETQTE
ncbi:LysR family transcriptional regulator [Vibrio quintilis]|uniref:HTH-type transcriptional regulator LeuO n=1 Tax=Vibrio quintilis TaxID=1117707 RepID=A0A1M7Z2A5_9VIBR|nr:LysR family transcriptional regulator [Vibrio quintilis]SHO59011.1 HTH-type transcriptional regulator LeuO [Vibrio quintilis]